MTYGVPPSHFQWKEAFFPTSPVAVVAAEYFPGEAGLRGTIYNLSIRFLRNLSSVLNIVLMVPMFVVIAGWFVVTLPFQLLRFAVTPGMFMSIIDIISYPGKVLIWLVYLPVKLCNLLIAIIAYLFGPKV